MTLNKMLMSFALVGFVGGIAQADDKAATPGKAPEVAKSAAKGETCGGKECKCEKCAKGKCDKKNCDHEHHDHDHGKDDKKG